MCLNTVSRLIVGTHFNLFQPYSRYISPSPLNRLRISTSLTFGIMSQAKHLSGGTTNPLCTLIKSSEEVKTLGYSNRFNYMTKNHLSTSPIINKPVLNYSVQKNHRNGDQPILHQKQDQSRYRRSDSSHHTLANSPSFRSMAGIQKLATEPTREHIENIRDILRHLNAKDNNNQEIRLEKDLSTGIATICIKSAAKNGISAKMMCDFLDVIDELYLWEEGKGVIIYGHDNFFCSGGDLVSIRELANYEDGLKMATLMQYNLARLQTLPMITMALIQGKAIGGGAEIATTMDLRMITKSAKIGYVHARIGIVAAWGGGCRLVQLVGPSRAIDMMSSGRLVDPGEALNMGLVNHVLDDTNLTCEQVMIEAKKYLMSHLIGVKATIIAIKGIVNAARTLPLEQALVAEAQLLSSTWGKPAHINALNSNVKHRGE